jgi:hypothetical protein
LTILTDCKAWQLPNIYFLLEVIVEEGGFHIHVMHLPSHMHDHD